jgi:hypothetical protein
VLRPRRNPLYIMAGAFLVVLLALTFMWLQLRADQAEAVLLVARPVAAGQVITSTDVTVVSVVPDPALRYVPESHAATVVGRTAAVPLVAGALLSPDHVGPAAWPGNGEAVVALPFKLGRIPTGVTAGARVRVLPIPAVVGEPAVGTPEGVTATVVAVESDVDSSGTVVVSLLLRAADAAVAATAGESTLVLLGPTG